jgi:glutathione S-transferase
MPTMKLYGYPPTRSIRVLWTLRELGVDFEFVNVNLGAGENRRPEFLALNPAGKLPVLVDGDFVLTESVAIVLYLAEKYADKGLLPAKLEARAQVNHWLLFTATELEQPLWRIARHTAIYPEDKRLPDEVGLARQDFLDMAVVMDEHMGGRRRASRNQMPLFVMSWRRYGRPFVANRKGTRFLPHGPPSGGASSPCTM